MGRWLIIAGTVIAAIGAILHFAPWLLNGFGRLPGDIRIETERCKIFMPITSMIAVSIVITWLINMFKR
jgi:hypothetical protein